MWSKLSALIHDVTCNICGPLQSEDKWSCALTLPDRCTLPHIPFATAAGILDGRRWVSDLDPVYDDSASFTCPDDASNIRCVQYRI